MLAVANIARLESLTCGKSSKHPTCTGHWERRVEAAEPTIVESERNRVDFTFYLGVIARRRWVILATLAAVVLGVAFYTLRQPKVYQATTSLIIDASAPRYLDNNQVQEVVDTGAGNYWYNKEHYETQYKVIISRAVSKRVVEKLGLDNDVAFLGLTHLKDPVALKNSLAHIDAVALLQSKIKVQPVKDSRLVYVVIEDLDPERAALLANEIAQAYIAENLSLKLRASDKSLLISGIATRPPAAATHRIYTHCRHKESPDVLSGVVSSLL